MFYLQINIKKDMFNDKKQLEYLKITRILDEIITLFSKIDKDTPKSSFQFSILLSCAYIIYCKKSGIGIFVCINHIRFLKIAFYLNKYLFLKTE